MKTFVIPKSTNNITNNYFVNAFVEYVRANNYPEMNTDKLEFFGTTVGYALCSTLDPNNSPVCDCVEMGYYEDEHKSDFLDRDESFHRFEGGWVLQAARQFHVFVDEHFYFFDF